MAKKRIPTLLNPYTRKGRWYKGAFHFHSTNSDGKISPREAVANYARRGYRIVAPSDHGFTTLLPQEWFPGVLLIRNLEICWPHLLHIGARSEGKWKEEGLMASLRRIRREGGFAVHCHPAWSDATWDDLVRTRPVDAVEICNHFCELENATGYSVERWDMLLQSGRKVWCFATDDTHFNLGFPPCDGGWVEIRCPRLTRDDVMKSLKAGSFYASQGPRLLDLSVRRGFVNLRSSPVTELRAVADGVGSGQVYTSRVPRTAWTVDYRGWWCQPRRYLRIELKDARGRVAWSNPLFVRTGGK